MKNEQPGKKLVTERMELEVLNASHHTALIENANDLAIADTMISVPHPFLECHAREWIKRAGAEYKSGSGYHWGLSSIKNGAFTGYVTLREIDHEHSQAELSFWICRKDWGNGFAKEACAKAIEVAFETLNINRIYAYHMVRNPTSGKILKHLGFQQEGLLRQCVIKWGKFEDVVLQAILEDDWQKMNHFRSGGLV